MGPTKDILYSRLAELTSESIDTKYIQEFTYRPFDSRYTYYIEGLGKNPYKEIPVPASYRPRYDIMKNFSNGDNT